MDYQTQRHHCNGGCKACLAVYKDWQAFRPHPEVDVEALVQQVQKHLLQELQELH